jgi:hypothetical protein
MLSRKAAFGRVDLNAVGFASTTSAKRRGPRWYLPANPIKIAELTT